MRLTVHTAIQYAPRHRGLRLALGYTRIRRKGTRDLYDLYGFLAGYSGGGCYDDGFFHVSESRDHAYLSYTDCCGSVWGEDRINRKKLKAFLESRHEEDLLAALSTPLFGTAAARNR